MSGRLTMELLLSRIKNNPLAGLKMLAMLVPILSIVAMFATILHIPPMNQKAFLQRSDYQAIIYADHPVAIEPHYALVQASIVSHLKVRDGGPTTYRSNYGVELYIGDSQNPNLQQTYFNSRNMMSGALSEFKGTEEPPAIAISYNTAKALKAGMNDTVWLKLDLTEELDTSFVPFVVKSILKPKYGDIEQGMNMGIGLALIEMNDEVIESLKQRGMRLQYASFLAEDQELSDMQDQIATYVTKDAQMRMATTFSKRSVLDMLLPVMAFLLIFLIMNREISHHIRKSNREIAILHALGAAKKSLSMVFILEQVLIIVLASLVSALVYKFVIFQYFIGMYVEPLMVWVVFGGCVLFGLISLGLVLKKLQLELDRLDTVELLQKKGES